MSQENVEVVRRIYEVVLPRIQTDLPSDDLLALAFHPDVELQQLADLPGTAGIFRGYEGLRQSSREVLESLDDVQFEPLEHAASGDKVAFVVRATGTGRGSGAPVEARFGHLFELKDERVTRWVVYANPEQALEAAGLRE